MKTAFVFAGQGAQYFNMGKELYDNYEIVRKTIEEANSVLDFKIEDLTFFENENLNVTEFTQPIVLAFSIAFFRLLTELGIKADCYAGLSLGEYSALVASGALDFKQAVALVRKRGKFMQEAVPEGIGGMTAVMNAERELIIKICNEASDCGIISAANFNAPGQIVIAGEIKALEKAETLLKENGIKKSIRLNVSGPFHTALLKTAADKLSIELKNIEFKKMEKPVITNLTGKEIKENEISDTLYKQIMSPVYWEDSINYMIENGATRFVEIGPGKALSSFIKRINKDVTIFNFDNQEKLDLILKDGSGFFVSE